MKTFEAQCSEISEYFFYLKSRASFLFFEFKDLSSTEAPNGVGLSVYEVVIIKIVLSLNS